MIRPNFFLIIAVKATDMKRGIFIPVPLLLIGVAFHIAFLVAVFAHITASLSPRRETSNSNLEENKVNESKKALVIKEDVPNKVTDRREKFKLAKWGVKAENLTLHNAWQLNKAFLRLRFSGPFAMVKVASSKGDSVSLSFF